MDELRELREQVYEANMELWRQKLVVLTWGNVSGVDRERGVLLIKPSGVAYEKLRPEQIVEVSLETGEKSGGLNPSSDTPTHLELYRAHKDIMGVTHTHSAYATMWAQAGRALPCYGTTHADTFFGEVPITRALTGEEIDKAYEAATGAAIREVLRKRPLDCPAALVVGHGPFTWGKNAGDSVHNAIVLEEIARMALGTLLIRPGAPLLDEAVMNKHYNRKHGEYAYYGQSNV